MFFHLKNIAFASGILVTLSCSIISCDRLYSNYLQENNSAKSGPTTKYEIGLYADSVKALLPFSKVKKSMIYTAGNYSFQISKYSHKGRPILYIEHGYIEGQEKKEKQYYIKDFKLILLKEKAVFNNLPTPYIYSNAYFKNDKIFYTEQKSALTESRIRNTKFEETALDRKNAVFQISFLEDALYQRHKFDLVFEGITECPKAKYLIFSRKEIDSYRASIKVEQEDDFIHAISSDPLRYHGSKLDIDWICTDKNDIVYSKGKLKRD